MSTIKKSEHKNYLDWHDGSHEDLFKKYIFPAKQSIFFLFANKIATDAQKDGLGNKPQLEKLGQQASEYCQELHQIFSDSNNFNSDNILKDKVNDIINMDYGSVSAIFSGSAEIFDEYGFQKAGILMKRIADIFSTMWQKSKSHTTILEKKG